MSFENIIIYRYDDYIKQFFLYIVFEIILLIEIIEINVK